jgi:hypothetical protein
METVSATIHRPFLRSADPVLPEEDGEVELRIGVTVSTPEADELVRKTWGGSVRVLSSRKSSECSRKEDAFHTSKRYNALQVDCLSEIHFFAQSPLVLMQAPLTAQNGASAPWDL